PTMSLLSTLLSLLKYLSDILYLHSFPTRRSSDLNVVRCKCGSTDTLGVEVKCKLFGHDDHVIIEDISSNFELVKELINLMAENLDRKSTRLNSSHVSISYAVFCLKKKKKKNESQS